MGQKYIDPTLRIPVCFQHMKCTAIFMKRGKWYLGWVEEIPGVNTQGKTLKEARANLMEALSLVTETYRDMVEADRPRGRVLRECVTV